MINLSFNHTHASILSFPTVTLPDFTLITGPNGAGKTHLLQAINEGAILVDDVPQGNNHNEIRMFDWASMMPHDAGAFSSESIRQERQSLFNNFQLSRNRDDFLEPMRGVVRNFQLGEEYLRDPVRLFEMDDQKLTTILGNIEQVVELRAQLAWPTQNLESCILGQLDTNAQEKLKAIADFTKKPIISLGEQEILSPAIPSWGQSDIFEQSFARMFVAYRDLRLTNELAEFKASKGAVAKYLSQEDFVSLHGHPPWDFVNKSLAKVGMDFEINVPSLNDFNPFQSVLRKRSTGVEIPFSRLSSGEKVLMACATWLYHSNDRRQLATLPKILLLDEIDAPLHPSMSKNVIDLITKVLVKEFGIKVIATTHSPSTVALAPEDNIYTMRPNEPGIHKSSKATALNILTDGVPTIAISYDGRRQVFVESPSDAKIYDKLYRRLRTTIISDRSLEFIATGTRKAGLGDDNTGCDVVKRIVGKLSELGNISVFGLVDWDGKNKPDERISVLAYGLKDGIENVILDPLLLGIAICRIRTDLNSIIGIPDGTSYAQLATGDGELFQKIVDSIGLKVFGSTAESMASASYIGGIELSADSRFFSTDDHTLEKMVVDAFPFLKSITKNQSGNLIEYIIDHVLKDNPKLVPVEIKAVLEDLLERPAHAEAIL
jgi:ABC-type iron transport system FetAB ATPase subunit